MRNLQPNKPSDSSQTPLLRRGEQAALAATVMVLFVSLAGYLWRLNSEQGRFIDIDRAEPQVVRFEVDVNTASWPELAQLPEIGETLARRIVETRENDGPFLDHSDIMRVRGIGPRTLERIQPYLMPMPAASNVAGEVPPAASIP